MGRVHSLVMACAVAASCFQSKALHAQAGCPRLDFVGEVHAGQSFQHRIDAGHIFLLENIASGWVIRVLPATGPRPAQDYAELATPPYRSPNPLLLTTDFSFRAQDTIAWNPREFHYFVTPSELKTASMAYQATVREPNRPAAGAALFPLLEKACTADLRILDARIAGGTANQSGMAATVASHFAQTAHTLETATTPTPLGRIVTLSFHVVFQGTLSGLQH